MIGHAGGWDEILIPVVLVLAVFWWGTRRKRLPEDASADQPEDETPD